MPRRSVRRDRLTSIVSTQPEPAAAKGSLLGVFLVIASAYFTREVLMPIAAAILFAFLLAPLSKALERIHLGRTASALAAVFLGIFALSSLAWCLMVQFNEFGKELPKYEQNIHAKLRQLGVADGGHISHIEQSLQEFRQDLTPTNAPAATNSARKDAPPGRSR